MIRQTTNLILLTLITLLTATACNDGSPHEQQPERFRNVVMNKMTPVKDQGSNNCCWAYAMLSTIETEHLMRGDSIHLSVNYAVRAMLEEQLVRKYLCREQTVVRERGMGSTLTNVIGRNGIVPYDAYHRQNALPFRAAGKKMNLVIETSINTHIGLDRFLTRMKTVFDDTYGPQPRQVYMYGAEYTPQEFARSVCYPGEYEALTSFTHHPFGERFVLEVPDNWERNEFLNIPIDSLTETVKQAVREGHGVCWEGDISEPGFSFRQGTAEWNGPTPTSQTERQKAFEQFQTTDDHCMAIVGLARNSEGKLHFVMKNSWGDKNPYQGLMYMSEDYFRMKTIAVFVPQ